MGLPRKVLVAPEGYLYQNIKDYFNNDPKHFFTVAGKARARVAQKEIMGSMAHWLDHNYAPMFDKYDWRVIESPDYRHPQKHLPHYHVEFMLKKEHLHE